MEPSRRRQFQRSASCRLRRAVCSPKFHVRGAESTRRSRSIATTLRASAWGCRLLTATCSLTLSFRAALSLKGCQGAKSHLCASLRTRFQSVRALHRFQALLRESVRRRRNLALEERTRRLRSFLSSATARAQHQRLVGRSSLLRSTTHSSFPSLRPSALSDRRADAKDNGRTVARTRGRRQTLARAASPDARRSASAPGDLSRGLRSLPTLSSSRGARGALVAEPDPGRGATRSAAHPTRERRASGTISSLLRVRTM